DWFGVQDTGEARLLPGLLDRDFRRGLFGFHAALWDHPAIAGPGSHQADASSSNRDGSSLGNARNRAFHFGFQLCRKRAPSEEFRKGWPESSGFPPFSASLNKAP